MFAARSIVVGGMKKSVVHSSAATTLHTALFLGLEIVCAFVFLHSLTALSPHAIAAIFIYYQPIVVLLAMLWLWSVVIWYFEGNAVKYSVCFLSEHHRHLMNVADMHTMAAVLTLATSANLACFAWANASENLQLASYMPGILYCALAAFLLLPVDICYKEQRMFYADTLRRVVFPFQAVLFTDFLLADILTSLAKPLSDMTLAVCHFASPRPLMISLADGFDEGMCSNHALTIPIVLSLPYLWRFCQCIIIYRTTGDIYQFFNAIKYCTAFPVIGLSYVKYYVPLMTWRSFYKRLWVVSAIVNTSYSFFWDVERDWEIKWFTGGGKDLLPPLKSDTRMFKSPLPYYWLIASNLVLRISWTYKLSSHLRHMRWFVLAMTLLEVFRRFQWSFIRIEHELRKIQNASPELYPLIPSTPKRKSSALSLDDDA